MLMFTQNWFRVIAKVIQFFVLESIILPPKKTLTKSIQVFFCCNSLFPGHTYIFQGTDYGRANKAFFRRNPRLLGLGRQFRQINFGVFGVFSDHLSAPNLVLWVPCPSFPLINHYFYKKLCHYIQIPNIYLGFGFEFGPQRFRDLAIVCP